MAFNIIAESNKKLDYDQIHRAIFSASFDFEFVPMPGLGLNNGDAFGICIPLKNATESTWIQLKPVLKSLKSNFGCDVYDLNGGQKLGFFNSRSFKRNLLGR